MTQHGKAIAISTPIASTSSGVADSDTVGLIQQTVEDVLEIPTITFAGEIVHQIKAIVESFRVGKIKKSQAIFQIGQILAAEPTGDDKLKSNSLDRYAATLDGIEALTAESS